MVLYSLSVSVLPPVGSAGAAWSPVVALSRPALSPPAVTPPGGTQTNLQKIYNNSLFEFPLIEENQVKVCKLALINQFYFSVSVFTGLLGLQNPWLFLV